MTNRQFQSETKSAELQALSYWLRTGRRLPLSAFESEGEQKFNPNHDPANWQFTFGPGGVSIAHMGRGPAGGMPTHLPQSASPHRVQGGRWHPSVVIGPIAEIPGFPRTGKTSWRSANDLDFSAASDFYNRKYGLKQGEQGFRTPEFMKAWAMRESGGEGDERTFRTDPFQVHNTGDHPEEKLARIGLRSNLTMTPARSAYFALESLRFKSFHHGHDGKVDRIFNDFNSLARYNGRNDHSRQSGRDTHSQWYAKTIFQMAAQASAARR